MEQLQILKYAYHGVLDVWSREYDRWCDNPTNPITKARFEKLDSELEAIRDLLRIEEQKVQ